MSEELVNFEVGQNAPDFEAELTDGTTIRLSEILDGGEKVILYFYPKDFTFVCPTEISEFARLNDDFTDRDAVLMGGSSDNEHCKLAWRRGHQDLHELNHWSFADTTGSFN